jgi:hypothetical protein
MNLREIDLRSVPLLPVNMPVGAAELKRKTAALVSDFLDICPSLKHMSSTTLVHRYRSNEDGLHLVFSLRETAQKLLQFQTSARKSNLEMEEGFRADLARVDADLLQLPLHILTSMSSNRSLAELLDSTDAGSKIRVIRKSMRSRSNLYPLIQPELLGMGFHKPQQIIPHGVRVHIEAHVHELPRAFVRLKNYTFVENVPAEVASIDFGSYLDVLRPSAVQNQECNLALIHALDESKVITIEAIAAFKWKDGAPAYFEFRSIQ